jgi:hypothetical protein
MAVQSLIGVKILLLIWENVQEIPVLSLVQFEKMDRAGYGQGLLEFEEFQFISKLTF